MSSTERAYCPELGDVVWINFDPQAGREQAGRRPALVLSPRRYNQLTRLCILCPITNQTKGYPFEVAIPDSLPLSGVILADQIKSMSWEQRESTFLCASPAFVILDVKAKVNALLKIAN